jgi:two-component system response regulator YesN
MSGRGILAVDDNVIMQNFYRVVFSSYLPDFRTVVAESGQEALEHIHEGPFKVIIADLRMPDMSGIDLYREVVKRCKLIGKQPPYFIFCSAVKSMDKYVDPAELTSPFSFLQKPFKPEEFVNSLHVHLGSSPD